MDDTRESLVCSVCFFLFCVRLYCDCLYCVCLRLFVRSVSVSDCCEGQESVERKVSLSIGSDYQYSVSVEFIHSLSRVGLV